MRIAARGLAWALPALLLAACADNAPTMTPPPEQRHITEDYFGRQLALMQARAHTSPWSAWSALGPGTARIDYRKRDINLQGIDLFCNQSPTPLPYATFPLYASVPDGLSVQGGGDASMSAQYGDEHLSDATKGTGVLLHLPLQCRLHTANFLRQVEIRNSSRYTVRVLNGDGTSSGPVGACEAGNVQCVAPGQTGLVDTSLVEEPADPVQMYARHAPPPGGWQPAFSGHDEEPLSAIYMLWEPGTGQRLSFLSQASVAVTLGYCITPSGRQPAADCESKPNGGSVKLAPGQRVSVHPAQYVQDPQVSVSTEIDQP